MQNMEINIFLCQHCHFNNINSTYTSTPAHQNWTGLYEVHGHPCYENTGRNIGIAPNTYSLQPLLMLVKW